MKKSKERKKAIQREAIASQEIAETEKSAPMPSDIYFDRDKFHFKPNYFLIPKGIINAFQSLVIKRSTPFNKANPVWHFCISFIMSYVKYNQITLGKKNVRVSYDLLEYLFGQDTYIVTSFLQEYNFLIKISNHSTQLRRCSGYKLNDNLLDKSAWEPFEFTEELKKMKKYENIKKKLFQGRSIKEDQNLAKLKNDPLFKTNIDKPVKGDKSKIFERVNREHKNVKMDKSCRIHHSYTNLRKDLRKKATYDGEPLMEIDVKSCQPLLLSALYGDNKKENGKTLYFEKHKLSFEEQCERNKFVDFCIHGKGFYAKLGISKSDFGFTMFGNLPPKAWFKLKMIKELKKHFPILVARLYGLRRCLRRQKNGRPFYGLVATFMQRWESYIMIDTAFKEMDFGAIPIHDSVLVPKDRKYDAIRLIVKAFSKRLGLPKIALNITNNDCKKRQENFKTTPRDWPDWVLT